LRSRHGQTCPRWRTAGRRWRGETGASARRASGPHSKRRRDEQALQSQRPATTRAGALQAQIVIHLRSHPHALTTPADHSDQLPWEFITAWLNRYGVCADALTVCSVTRTPPASGLRSDSAALLGARNTQHHDTWLTYTLRREQRGRPDGSQDHDGAPAHGIEHEALTSSRHWSYGRAAPDGRAVGTGWLATQRRR
jgi:hypothetical protein